LEGFPLPPLPTSHPGERDCSTACPSSNEGKLPFLPSHIEMEDTFSCPALEQTLLPPFWSVFAGALSPIHTNFPPSPLPFFFPPFLEQKPGGSLPPFFPTAIRQCSYTPSHLTASPILSSSTPAGRGSCLFLNPELSSLLFFSLLTTQEVRLPFFLGLAPRLPLFFFPLPFLLAERFGSFLFPFPFSPLLSAAKPYSLFFSPLTKNAHFFSSFFFFFAFWKMFCCCPFPSFGLGPR